jgi:glyceraldehyde-3-phosphate dehydrogenase/erythrose-4-phosphate dehydrogenase
MKKVNAKETKMAVKVAVNGFGRIGRMAFSAAHERDDI